MKRPPDAVLRGLRTLAGVVEAGTSDDILGFDYDLANAEERARWDDIMAAARWIEAECHPKFSSEPKP